MKGFFMIKKFFAIASVFVCAMSFAAEKLLLQPPEIAIRKFSDFKADGVFSEAEVKNTVGMYGFHEYKGIMFPHESIFQVGTDGKKLYIGVQCETGENGIRQRARKGPGGNKAFNDDCFEFVVVPNPKAAMPDIYHIIINNKGSYMTKARIDNAAAAWEPKFECNGIVKDRLWTYEIEFPFEQFGMAEWKDGEVIGLRICRNWRNLAPPFNTWGKQSCWSQLGSAFFDSDRIPLVTLKSNAPIVRFLQLTNKENKADCKVSIFNPNAEAITLASDYYMKPTRSQSVTEQGKVELDAGETKVLALRVPQLTENEQAQTSYQLKMADGTVAYQRAFTWKQEKSYLFERALSDTERLATRFAFYAESDKLFIQIDASAVANPTGLGALKAEITDKAGAMVAKVDLPPFKNSVSEYLWELPPMKEYTATKNSSGEYTLTFFVGNEKITRKFERKIFDWEGNQYGKSDILVHPFTAIQVKKNTVSTILRDHAMSAEGLWEQVKADGENLFLDKGMRLIASIGGKEVIAKGKGVKFTKTTATRVEGYADWNALDISGRTEFFYDYDGMMRFNLKVNGSKTTIDNLRLVTTLDAKNAYLFHACTDGLRFNYGGATPNVWDATKAARSDLLTSYVNYIWLGTEGRGFSIFGENDKGWVLEKGVPTQTMQRTGDKIVLTYNLIAKPAVLENGTLIDLAVQATPIKPMRKNWRLHIAAWGTPPSIHKYMEYVINFYGSSYCEGCVTASDDIMPRDNDLTIWKMFAQVRKTKKVPEGFIDEWVKGYHHTTDPERLNTYRREISYGMNVAKNAREGEITYYTNARGQRQDIPPARTFLDDWFREDFDSTRTREPAYGASKSYSIDPVASYRDYAMSCYKHMFDIGNCDNIYWDDIFLASNYDHSGSEPAYYLEDGKMQPSVGLFNMRELIRRTAVYMTERGRTQLNNMVHMTNTAIAPICAFAQQNLDWEDNNGTNPFQQRYTREYIRAVSIARQFGNQPAALGLVPSVPGNEWCLRTGTGVSVTHEIQWCKMGASKSYVKVLEMMYGFGYGNDDVVKVHNYWDRDYPVAISGGESSSIFLEKGTEAQFMLCSYDDDRSFTVKLPGKFSSAVNGETGKVVALQDNTMNLPLAKHDFIFVILK